MKIYTAQYDFNRPNLHTITVPTNTDYMIGISAKKNCELIDLTTENVSMRINGQDYSPSKVVNGFVAFDYSQGRDPITEIAKINITKEADSAEGINTSAMPFLLDVVALPKDKIAKWKGVIKAKDVTFSLTQNGEDIQPAGNYIQFGQIPNQYMYMISEKKFKRGQAYLDEIEFSGDAIFAQLVNVSASAQNPIILKVTIGKDTIGSFDLMIVGKHSGKGDVTVEPSFLNDLSVNNLVVTETAQLTGTVVIDPQNFLNTDGDVAIPNTTALFEGEYEDGEPFSMNVYIA